MKKRLDILLVEKGMANSRERAKEMIKGGKVLVDGKQIIKASTSIEDTANILYEGEVLKYVSRGGLKLEKAIDCFHINLDNKICMDIGASTGGFTDCMLQNGAAIVYAVDVGHHQLATKLLEDNRVVNMEGTNIRYMTKEDVAEEIDFATIDVSFISLTKVLVPVKEFLSKEGKLICLVKPQFEAGKKNLNKKGVVKDSKVHIKVIKDVITFAKEIGFQVLGLDYSPVKGPEGNIEYLLYLGKSENVTNNLIDPLDVVERSHSKLDK